MMPGRRIMVKCCKAGDLKDLLYSIRHMLFRVPLPMVRRMWRVGRVVLSHRLNSAWLGIEDILRQLRWSGMAAERRGLQQGCAVQAMRSISPVLLNHTSSSAQAESWGC